MKTRIALAAMGAALVFGCGSEDKTDLLTPPMGEVPSVPVGVGEVGGLPGTPLEMSALGLPVIEGVERPDYAEDGINSFQKRWERKSDTNPTGEYRFSMDPVGPDEIVADADDAAGFRNGLEEYTWRLTHPTVVNPYAVTTKGIFRSAVFHGKAFRTNSDGTINGLGACWLAQNAGEACEFPSSLNRTWRLAWGDKPGDEFSTCSHDPSIGGTHAPGFYIDPSNWIQEAFDKWLPDAPMTQVLSNNERITVFCQQLPGSAFGGIMGRSGGYGPRARRVTNAHDAYGSTCGIPSGAFPHSLYTYDDGEIQYSADNLYQRAILCNADQSRIDMLHIASVNMFMHELGHFLGFAHFSTGIMNPGGGDCTMFYSTLRSIPAAFHTALSLFQPTSGTFNFIQGATCNSQSTLLPVPLPNDQQNQVPNPNGHLSQ